MKILVTGGAGFIGSHLCDAYLKAGHDVIAVDNLCSGRESNIASLKGNFRFEKMDILSPDFRKFVVEEGPDVINHHAAQKSVRESVLNPRMDAEQNILGLLEVLEAARTSKCRRILFASSGGVIFDEDHPPPYHESSRIRPSSPYGITKLSSEYYLDFYSKEHGFECTAFRYANVYGPRQDPLGEAGVVAIFCMQILKNEGITIFGTGEQTRDFIYVEDLARLNLMALQFWKKFQVFNVGTGMETSVNQLARALMDIAKRQIPIGYQPARPGEAMRSALNSSLLSQNWSWRPEFDIQRGLQQTFKWFQTKA